MVPILSFESHRTGDNGRPQTSRRLATRDLPRYFRTAELMVLYAAVAGWMSA